MIVYKLTNSTNGKAYVGVTICGLAKRWKDHRAMAVFGEKTPLYCAIRKYGASSFTVKVLCECSSFSELAACERGLIAEHGTYVPLGYNVTTGGDGCRERMISSETRKKLSDAYWRRFADGKHPKRAAGSYRHSEETKRKCQIRRIPVFGEEARRRISEAHRGDRNVMRRDPAVVKRVAEKRRGAKRTPEMIARIRAGRRASAKLTFDDVARMKAIISTTPQSASTIAAAFGVSRSMVSSIKLGKRYGDVAPGRVEQMS